MGIIHTGTHPDIAEACRIADEKAALEAFLATTCWKPAKAYECTFADGLYTCTAESAKHRGSCKGAGYIMAEGYWDKPQS
jgi:hypothetical protein